MKKKLFCSVALVCILTVLFCSGCQTQQPQTPPEPNETEPTPAIVSSLDQLRDRSLTVYLPAQSFSSVTMRNVSLHLLPFESAAEAAVKSLLAHIHRQDETSRISLLSFAVTDQTAIVNLTGDFNTLTDKQFFVLAYCLTNTLCEIDNIAYVNILVNDHAIDDQSVPYGVLTRFDEDLETAYWQFSTLSENASDRNSFYTKKVTLYFGSQDDSYLVAEPQDVSFVGGYPAADSLIAALATGPMDTTAVRLLPSTAYLSQQELTTDDATGLQSLSLRIEGSVYAYWTRNELSESLASASVAMTFFDYYPNLDHIVLAFDRQEGAPVSLWRTQQELHIGTALEVFYPRADGGLSMVRRVVSAHESASTDRIFELMFDRPDFLDEVQIQSVFPEPLDLTDILSVSIEQDTAVIRVSARFVDTIRALDSSRERDVIFSIVNTLCRTRDVKRVTFQEADAPCPNIDGRINLSDYLYYNPGIIRQ